MAEGASCRCRIDAALLYSLSWLPIRRYGYAAVRPCCDVQVKEGKFRETATAPPARDDREERIADVLMLWTRPDFDEAQRKQRAARKKEGTMEGEVRRGEAKMKMQVL